MGKEVGITATKAIKDFNQAAPLLARYGRDNIKVFKELQAEAKAKESEQPCPIYAIYHALDRQRTVNSHQLIV